LFAVSLWLSNPTTLDFSWANSLISCSSYSTSFAFFWASSCDYYASCDILSVLSLMSECAVEARYRSRWWRLGERGGLGLSAKKGRQTSMYCLRRDCQNWLRG